MALYGAQTRSCWNYHSPDDSPVEGKNAFKLGQAQRRVSRTIRGMESLFYQRSLCKLNLLSLGKQRLGGDMTTLLKMHRGRRQHIVEMKELAEKKEEHN